MAKRLPAAVRDYMRKLGAEGGKRSSKALTAAERSERARRAAVARWKKARPAR